MCVSLFKSSLHEYVLSELNWLLKLALLPSVCSGFGGFDRALGLTIVCSTSQVINLCLMSFDFPILNSLHFDYGLLFCVFSDGVFIPHRAF